MLSNILVGLTILLTPLYIIRFSIGILPTTLLEVLIVGAVVSFLIEEMLAGRVGQYRKLLTSEFSGLALVLLLFSIMAVLASPTQYQALGLWRAYFLEPILFYLVVLAKLRRGFGKQILTVWILSGVWIAGLAILQKFTGQFTTPDSVHELTLGRAAAVFNSANDVPLFLGPLAAVSVALVRQTKWVWVAALMIFTAIWTSGSRGGMAALGAVETIIFVGWILAKVPGKWREVFWKVAAALGVLAVLAMGYFFINIDRYTPAQKIVYPRPYSDTAEVRLCLWQGTKNLLLDHSLPFGAGLNGFKVLYPSYRTCDSEELQYPHNIILNFWSEIGLAGLGAIVLIYFVAFRSVLRSKARYLVKVSLIAALAYSVGHGLVDVPYFKNDLSVEFWILLAVIAATLENRLDFSKQN